MLYITCSGRQPPPPSHLLTLGTPPALASSSSTAWEGFFIRNTTSFFKDRHWFRDEYPETLARLGTTPCSLLDLGCGCGNSALPLLESCPLLTRYVGIDGSAKAVELMKRDARFDSAKCVALVGDIASPLPHLDLVNQYDVVLLIFVLSALTPRRMRVAVELAASSLRPGGVVLFRDYAVGDLAASRFPLGARQSRGSYTRSDGTLSFFFTQAGLIRLFADAQLECSFCKRLERVVVNRKTGAEMHRFFFSGQFRRRIW